MGKLEVRIPVRPGRETDVFLWVWGKGCASVDLHGVFLSADDAPPSPTRDLDSTGIHHARTGLLRLQDGEEEGVIRFLRTLTPGVLPWLETVHAPVREGAFRSRVAEVLTALRK